MCGSKPAFAGLFIPPILTLAVSFHRRKNCPLPGSSNFPCSFLSLSCCSLLPPLCHLFDVFVFQIILRPLSAVLCFSWSTYCLLSGDVPGPFLCNFSCNIFNCHFCSLPSNMCDSDFVSYFGISHFPFHCS